MIDDRPGPAHRRGSLLHAQPVAGPGAVMVVRSRADSVMVVRSRADSVMVVRSRADSVMVVRFAGNRRVRAGKSERQTDHMTAVGFYDRRLKIVEIQSRDGGSLIPESVDAWVELGSRGRFVIFDSVNVFSGAFSRVPGGLRLYDVGATLMGYDGRDATRAALVSAAIAIAQEQTIEIQAAGGGVTLTANDNRLTCA